MLESNPHFDISAMGQGWLTNRCAVCAVSHNNVDFLTLNSRVAEGSSTHSNSRIPSATSILFLVLSLMFMVLSNGSRGQR